MLLIVSEMNLYSTSLDGGGRLCRPGFDCVDLDVNMVDTNKFQITLDELIRISTNWSLSIIYTASLVSYVEQFNDMIAIWNSKTRLPLMLMLCIITTFQEAVR